MRTLQRELEARGCRVRVGGEHDAWDLEARTGPLWKARITTAVVWGWTPLWRVRFRPRAIMGLGVAVLAGLFPVGALWSGVGLATLAAVASIDVIRLRWAVAAARAATSPEG